MSSDRFSDIFSAVKSASPEEKPSEKANTAKRGNPEYGNYSVLIPKSLRRKVKIIQAEFEDECGEELEYSEIVELLLTNFVNQCETENVHELIKALRNA